MTFSLNLLWLFVVAMLISSIGFKNYIWFISIGYGLSVAGEGLLMLFLYGNQLTVGTILCNVLFIIYGLRLSGYLAYREFKITSYNKNMVGEVKQGKDVPFGVKLAIWVTCALLYVTQVLPVFYRLQNGKGTNLCTWIGAIIMICGVVLESVADMQKNKAKKINSKRFVDTGLYCLVRCPNYLGEMIFWTGVLISGFGALAGVGQWILALIGYVGIIFVMFSGARRLEIRQNKNYADDSEYQKYVETVSILLSFIPLYSIENINF